MRPLTERERAWLFEALALLPTGEYLGGGRWVNEETGEVVPLGPPVDPAPYLAQVDELVVVDLGRWENFRVGELVPNGVQRRLLCWPNGHRSGTR